MYVADYVSTLRLFCEIYDLCNKDFSLRIFAYVGRGLWHVLLYLQS